MKESNTVIPTVSQRGLEITLVGTHPLIVGRFPNDFKRKGDKTPELTTEKTPEETFNESMYKGPNGEHEFPAIAFKKAMERAAKNLGEKKLPSTIVRMSCYVEDEFVTLTCSNPVMKCGIARNQNAKSAPVKTYNAMYENWGTTLRIRFIPNMISKEQIAMLLQAAGQMVGVGVMRPEKQGTPFGLFNVMELAEYAI